MREPWITAVVFLEFSGTGYLEGLQSTLRRGVQFLVRSVESGSVCDASPMGFYFAKLWYFERLYPLVFALAALGRARGVGGKSLFS